LTSIRARFNHGNMKILLPGLLLLVLFPPLQAALPVAVDGQQLPSLAPILESATPAVVEANGKGMIMNIQRGNRALYILLK